MTGKFILVYYFPEKSNYLRNLANNLPFVKINGKKMF